VHRHEEFIRFLNAVERAVCHSLVRCSTNFRARPTMTATAPLAGRESGRFGCSRISRYQPLLAEASPKLARKSGGKWLRGRKRPFRHHSETGSQRVDQPILLDQAPAHQGDLIDPPRADERALPTRRTANARLVRSVRRSTPGRRARCQ
jgi:hypothetical protein